MKHVKIYETKKSERDMDSIINHLFYFLNELPMNMNPKASLEFIKSLNLTNDQYVKLAEIIENYARERYRDGVQEGYDQCPEY